MSRGNTVIVGPDGTLLAGASRRRARDGYQLMFQRTIPGFEPSPATFALSIEGLERLKARLVAMEITDQRSLDLLTVLGTGITDLRISNDPGGDRWIRLVDEAVEMYFNHVTNNAAKRKRTRR